MSGAISVWSCQRWRAVRSSADCARLLGFRVKSTGALRFSRNGRWQWNEGGRRREKKNWNRAQKNPIQNPRTSPRSVWEHRKQRSVRFRVAVVHVLPQTASVLHKTYAIYILPDRGDSLIFPRRTPSTEPSNINIPSPNRSSEPPLVLGVLRRSKSPHTGHYSSRKGFRVRNLDTATMASLFFCCLARWESKTALSGLLSAFPVCLDRHRASEQAREKKGREREQADWYDGMSETNILPWKKERRESNQEVSAEG